MRRRRNTTAFTFLSWASFILAISFILVAIWNTEWVLVEKGYYAGCMIWAIYSSFVLSKVIRDNEDDKDEFGSDPFSFSKNLKE